MGTKNEAKVMSGWGRGKKTHGMFLGVSGDLIGKYKRRVMQAMGKFNSFKLPVVNGAVLKQVLIQNPLIRRGLVQGDPKLYRRLSKLRRKAFVVRAGFRYYPTKYAYLWLEKERAKERAKLPHFMTQKRPFEANWKTIFTPQKKRKR